MKASPSIVAVFGATGQGKSLFVNRELDIRRPVRLLVWDQLLEHGKRGQVVHTQRELYARATAIPRGAPLALVYQPARECLPDFDFFCEVAYALGDLTMVVEELAFVTSPNSACPGWKRCTSTGRHKWLSIIGTSQRPASVDKFFFSNATRVRTHRLNYGDDIKTMANVLNLKPLPAAKGAPARTPEDQILNLEPLHYIERDMQSGNILRGKLKKPPG